MIFIFHRICWRETYVGGCEGACNLNNVRGAMGKIIKCTKKWIEAKPR